MNISALLTQYIPEADSVTEENMTILKVYLTRVAWLILCLLISSANGSSCNTASTFKKLELNIGSSRNDTGHWITDVQADFEGETPNVWTVNVQRLSTECNGDKHVRLSASVTVPPPRPKDYQYYPGTGYYKFHTDVTTFDEAKSICEEENSHLAIVNSEDESKVLMEMFARQPKGLDWAFVGFHDRYKEGEFLTIFGEPLNTTGFTRWSSSGQPDDAGGNEDCGSIHRNGGLNDISCTSKLYFICEYELW